VTDVAKPWETAKTPIDIIPDQSFKDPNEFKAAFEKIFG
jgi:hypothetical protein